MSGRDSLMRPGNRLRHLAICICPHTSRSIVGCNVERSTRELDQGWRIFHCTSSQSELQPLYS